MGRDWSGANHEGVWTLVVEVKYTVPPSRICRTISVLSLFCLALRNLCDVGYRFGQEC